jgi:hypothetical protein
MDMHVSSPAIAGSIALPASFDPPPAVIVAAASVLDHLARGAVVDAAALRAAMSGASAALMPRQRGIGRRPMTRARPQQCCFYASSDPACAAARPRPRHSLQCSRRSRPCFRRIRAAPKRARRFSGFPRRSHSGSPPPPRLRSRPPISFSNRRPALAFSPPSPSLPGCPRFE